MKDTLAPAPETTAAPSRSGGRRAALVLLALLPLLVTAALTSYFYYQSRYDESVGHYAYPWQAKWISTSSPKSNYGAFRKTIYIDGSVRSGYIAIAANNYCSLYVNGQVTVLDQIGRESSPYTAIGVPRHTVFGHLIDVSYRLHPGANVIAVLADTDENHAPQIVVQGSIETTHRQTFVSDATWKCAPAEQTQAAQPWYSVDFIDNDWAQATASTEPVTSSVDTLPGPIETPYQGAFIASLQAADGSVTFRRDFDAPGATTQGWMRVVCSSPYDMTLNGQTLASNSLSDGFNKKLVMSFLGMDGLVRANANAAPDSLPMAAAGRARMPFF